MKFLFGVIFVLLTIGSMSNGGMYPKCWIKKGECLDNNVGPLIEAIPPQINHNIVKNASMGVESLDDCAQQCFNETECRFVTEKYKGHNNYPSAYFPKYKRLNKR